MLPSSTIGQSLASHLSPLVSCHSLKYQLPACHSHRHYVILRGNRQVNVKQCLPSWLLRFPHLPAAFMIA